MADVKINGNTYTGISKVSLPLASGGGSAIFNEDSGGTVSAVYPMPYSEFSGSTTQKTVSDGNHVEIHSTATSGSFTINIPQSVNSIITSRSFDNSHKPYPTIPQGAEVTVAIKNITVTEGLGYAVGMTVPNGTADMNASPLGEDGGAIEGTNGRKSFTFTTTEPTNISSFYLVFQATGNFNIEFDLELTVNGVRWI